MIKTQISGISLRVIRYFIILIKYSFFFKKKIQYMPKEYVISWELEDNEAPVSKKTDIWSIGCLILEIFTGDRPWNLKSKNL